MEYKSYSAYRNSIKSQLGFIANLKSNHLNSRDDIFFNCIKNLYTRAIEDLTRRTNRDTSYVYSVFEIANEVENKDRGEGLVTLGRFADEMQYIRGLFRDMFLHDLKHTADKDSLLQSRANHLLGSQLGYSKSGWLIPSDISDILSDLFKAANVSKDKASAIVKEAFRTQGYSKEQQEEFVKLRFFDNSSVFYYLEQNPKYVMDQLGGIEGVMNEMNRLLQENIDLWIPVIGEDLISKEIGGIIKSLNYAEINKWSDNQEPKASPTTDNSTKDIENFQKDVNEKYNALTEPVKNDEIVVNKRRIAPEKPKPTQDKEPQPKKKPKCRSLSPR